MADPPLGRRAERTEVYAQRHDGATFIGNVVLVERNDKGDNPRLELFCSVARAELGTSMQGKFFANNGGELNHAIAPPLSYENQPLQYRVLAAPTGDGIGEGRRPRSPESQAEGAGSTKRQRLLEPVDIAAETIAARAFLASLLTVVPQEIPVDEEDEDVDHVQTFSEKMSAGPITVLPLAHTLGEATADCAAVTTTPQARQLWRDVFAQLAKPRTLNSKSHRCIIVGSPGIGKSWSVLWALRELLVAEHANGHRPTVVLEQATSAFLYIFRFVDGAYSVTVQSDYLALVHSGLLTDLQSYYIYDASTDGKSSHPIAVPAKTVLVCSPDPAHFKQFAASATSPHHMIPWTTAQLLAVRHLLWPSFSEADLEQRIHFVGPIPRKICCDDDEYRVYENHVMSAATDQQVLISRVIKSGLSLLTRDSENKAPLSALFMIDVLDSFRSPMCRFVSAAAARALSRAAAGLVLNKIATAVPAERRYLGEGFEELVYDLLASGWDGVEPQAPTRLRPRWWQALERIAASPPDVLYLTGANCPYIDAALGRNRVYQVTIAKRKPTINLEPRKGSPAGTTPALMVGRTAADPLHFVFVVEPGSDFVPPPVHVNGAPSDAIVVSRVAVPALADKVWGAVFKARRLLDAEAE
eukprot:c20636_g8_i1.p1 GENE.c20636_g8_i1~~c20636_g8_i1.p1  ORF type:complete len:641 (-),score=103.85 c20636_g8_i1:35-1957(-)